MLTSEDTKKIRKTDTRLCVECGKSFTCRCDSKAKSCSLKCAAIHLNKGIKAQPGQRHWNDRKIEKVCERCGLSFRVSPSAHKQKFCSKTCHDKSSSLTDGKVVEKICVRCGKAFSLRGYAAATRKVCSVDCGPTKEFNCKVCGIVFALPYGRWRNGRGACCSNTCRNEYVKHLSIESAAQRKVLVTCQGCGKERLTRKGFSYKKFCSRQCYYDANKAVWLKFTCLWCSEEFSRQKSQLEASDTTRRCVFCSKSCQAAYSTRYCQSRTSKAETRFFDLLERVINMPIERQARFGRYTADGLIRDRRIVLEFDGLFWHQQDSAVKRDQKKDSLAVSLGLRMIRIQDTDFVQDPRRTVKVIAKAVLSEQETLFPR